MTAPNLPVPPGHPVPPKPTPIGQPVIPVDGLGNRYVDVEDLGEVMFGRDPSELSALPTPGGAE
mgnify:CR=1 FL=1